MLLLDNLQTFSRLKIAICGSSTLLLAMGRPSPVHMQNMHKLVRNVLEEEGGFVQSGISLAEVRSRVCAKVPSWPESWMQVLDSIILCEASKACAPVDGSDDGDKEKMKVS